MDNTLILWAFFIIIAGLMILGVPIYLCFLAGGVFYVLVDPQLSVLTVPQLLLAGMDKWSLLAIPLYILAGLLLAYGGAAKYLVQFFDSLVGHFRGGMLIVAVVACMFFSAMSGSGPATTVAIGAVMVGPLVALGYNKNSAMGAISTTATLGNVIPPSIAFVLIGSLAQQDVGKLFIGGLLPGLFIGLCLCIAAYFVSYKDKFKVRPPATWKERGRSFVKAIPALIMPLIILGGIYGGIFTPTEAAAVACLWGVVTTLIYREVKVFQQTRESLLDAAKTTGKLFLLMGGAVLFAQILTYNGIPQAITSFVTGTSLSWWGFMLLALLLYVVLGMLLDAVPIIVVTIPILFPVAEALGINPIHYSVFTCAAIVAGQGSPPYGLNLFAMSGLTKEPVENVIKGAIPFVIALYVAIVAFIFMPFLSYWLPNLMG